MTDETKNVKKAERGDVIFQKGEKVNQIGLLVKGSVMIAEDYIQIPLQPGALIGILDINSSEYLFNYIVMDTATICYFDYSDIADIGAVGTVLKEYRDFSIQNACNQMEEMIDVYETLDGVTHKLYAYIKEYYKEYLQLCNDYMKKGIQLPDVQNLELYDEDTAVEEGLIRYFQSLSEMPEEVRKPFFEEDDDVTGYNMLMASRLAGEINQANLVMYEFYKNTFSLLYNKGINNVFSVYSKLAMDVADAGGDLTRIMHDIEKIIALIKECKDLVEETLGLEFPYDFSRINDICRVINAKSEKSGVEEDAKDDILLSYSEAQIQQAMKDVTGSLKKILEYSRIDKERAELFEKYLTVYRGLKDPFSTEDEVRSLRNRITAMYYEIYEKVFFVAERINAKSRLIDMFLNFGFMDETMFDREKIVALYYLDNSQWNDKANVYFLRQWLHAIYVGEKEPSKNEFDMDYEENFRELKKTQKFTPEEERAYLNDQEAKVRYEIDNMVRTNNRLTNGQLLTFCPVLKNSDFGMDVEKMFVGGKKAQEELLSVTDVDFSAFYREYLYEDEENKISRLNLNKEVLPDIIFMPNAGHKGSMWQEISGKKRDTAGRFILPAFTMDNLNDMIIRLVGAFRWELCRTVQGTYWNDVREKSLTAEYCDYIQFYKKNRELSDDAKEKIRTQLQKARNNTREMFVKDYELWIKNESMGMARVNKIVRIILFAYCPFSKQYRQKIADQPLFRDGIAKYERERIKKIKELNNRFAAIRNAGGNITELLDENMNYLREQ